MATKGRGNVLGNDRAEADAAMLSCAFVETPEYFSLTGSRDHHIVVGRRGTGKSALFIKLSDLWSQDKNVLLLRIEPTEEEIDGRRRCALSLANSYLQIRGFCKIAWKTLIFLEILRQIRGHYRFARMRSELTDQMKECERWERLPGRSNCDRLHLLIKNVLSAHKDDQLFSPESVTLWPFYRGIRLTRSYASTR